MLRRLTARKISLLAFCCLAAIALGFIGALFGYWIARGLNLPEVFAINVEGVAFPVIWSIIGSALFVAVISLISRPRYYP